MEKKRTRINPRFIVFVHDVVMIALAWTAAYVVRQNLAFIPQDLIKQSIPLLPVVLVIQTSFFILFGLYRGIWRFASIPDLMRIMKSVGLGVIVLLLYAYFVKNINVIPRSIPLLYAIFLVLFLSFGRLSVRLRNDRKKNTQNQIEAKRVLIIGSGNQAEKLIREIIFAKELAYRPIAIVDNDKSKHQAEIHGIRIYSGFHKIEKLVQKYHVDIIFIALENASAKEMESLLKACQDSKTPFRIIPSFSEQLQQSKLLKTLREVNVEDLLGRETYQIDITAFENVIHHKKILITGGGGSIGSELAKQVASLQPKELLIIDHSEANLYHVELMLREKFPALKLTIALLDVSQYDLLSEFFEKHQPNIVFHAAAYKHVPMLEKQVLIAVRNNIIGSKNVIDLAIRNRADIFVQVSTDKAVNPTNIMGLTKRIAEMYCQQYANHSTKMITVRFGNVLGSVGSVVPLFKKQLENDGPLTVTHPEMTRYFMTIPEACRLILQAMVMGNGGEIFVLDMGKPIKIQTLAERMIYLSGKQNIHIIYTGLRPGEKLYEELFYEQENILKTAHQKIHLAESKKMTEEINTLFFELVSACYAKDEEKMFEAMITLVPEYSSEKLTAEI